MSNRDRKCPQCGKPTIWMYCSKACEDSRIAALRANALRRKPCGSCGNLHDRRGRYCSDACKQRAYRLRVDPQCGTYANRVNRAQSAARTKQRREVVIRCDECGGHVRYSLAETTNRKYCSDACKMRAYRKRKKQA